MCIRRWQTEEDKPRKRIPLALNLDDCGSEQRNVLINAQQKRSWFLPHFDAKGSHWRLEPIFFDAELQDYLILPWFRIFGICTFRTQESALT